MSHPKLAFADLICRDDKGQEVEYFKRDRVERLLAEDLGWRALTPDNMPEEGTDVLCEIEEHQSFPILGYFIYQDDGSDLWREVSADSISRPLRWAPIPKR